MEGEEGPTVEEAGEEDMGEETLTAGVGATIEAEAEAMTEAAEPAVGATTEAVVVTEDLSRFKRDKS